MTELSTKSQKALDHFRKTQQVSISGLQRQFEWEFNVASEVMNELENAGLVVEIDKGFRRLAREPKQITLTEITSKCYNAECIRWYGELQQGKWKYENYETMKAETDKITYDITAPDCPCNKFKCIEKCIVNGTAKDINEHIMCFMPGYMKSTGLHNVSISTLQRILSTFKLNRTATQEIREQLNQQGFIDELANNKGRDYPVKQIMEYIYEKREIDRAKSKAEFIKFLVEDVGKSLEEATKDADDDEKGRLESIKQCYGKDGLSDDEWWFYSASISDIAKHFNLPFETAYQYANEIAYRGFATCLAYDEKERAKRDKGQPAECQISTLISKAEFEKIKAKDPECLSVAICNGE